jgi:hypothetical protein
MIDTAGTLVKAAEVLKERLFLEPELSYADLI